MKIILASASPRRKMLLEQIGLKFKVVSSNVEEKITKKKKPCEIVKNNALKKAEDVASRHHGLIIAADTIVVCGGKILGKPKDKKEAEKMLSFLSGKWHEVFSGVVVLNTRTKEKVVKCVKTRVKMKKLSKDEIKAYVATKEPLDKAGAYAIQGLGTLLIDKIEGSYTNVVGLPLEALGDVLKKFGVKIF
jgi:septum formation protein